MPDHDWNTQKAIRLPERMIVNGELVHFNQATTHVMTSGTRYGLNAFEGLRGYYSEPGGVMNVFRLPDHLRRLWQSMKILRFEPSFAAEDIVQSLVTLMASGVVRETCHIRIAAYLEGFGDHTDTSPISYFVYAAPLPRSANVVSGIRCQVSSWTRISDGSMPPRAKTGANYVNLRLARLQAKQDGYDDAILLNADGSVSEGPGAAIFLVRDGRLITPHVTSGILEGITRQTIITLAQDDGLSVEERSVDRTEIYLADELFFAGTASEIVPILSVDGLVVGSGNVGQITAGLQADYFDLVGGKPCKRTEWLRPMAVR